MATVVAKPTYLELISQDEKTVQKEHLSIEAQKSSILVQTEILTLNSQIANKKTEISKAQKAIPYSVGVEYKLTKELSEVQARLDFAQGIKAERFSDVSI